MTTDRAFMLNGPYTGVMLHEPISTRRRTRTRIFYILAGIAVVVGGLWGLAHP